MRNSPKSPIAKKHVCALLIILAASLVVQAQSPSDTPVKIPGQSPGPTTDPIRGGPQFPSTTSISGVVTSRGEVISNAQVTVINRTTGEQRATTTDSEGRFSISGLRPGRYIVSVESPSFAKFQREVELNVGQTSSLNLDIGGDVLDIPRGTPGGGGGSGGSSGGSGGGGGGHSSGGSTTTTPKVEIYAKSFERDTDLLVWLNAMKGERKRLSSIVQVSDKNSLFVFERMKPSTTFSYTVLLASETLEPNNLLTRINQNTGKTFIGVHRLGESSYLFVAYGK
jgi:hypothetical protein